MVKRGQKSSTPKVHYAAAIMQGEGTVSAHAGQTHYTAVTFSGAGKLEADPDRVTLLGAMYVYLGAEPAKPLPDWMRQAFRRAYEQVSWAFAGSYDDVFGKPLKPRERLAAKRKRKMLETPVWKRVHEYKAAGVPTDRALFEQVAEEFGMGRRQVEEMFYTRERALGRSTPWDPPPE
jgi:hypothetical protein